MTDCSNVVVISNIVFDAATISINSESTTVTVSECQFSNIVGQEYTAIEANYCSDLNVVVEFNTFTQCACCLQADYTSETVQFSNNTITGRGLQMADYFVYVTYANLLVVAGNRFINTWADLLVSSEYQSATVTDNVVIGGQVSVGFSFYQLYSGSVMNNQVCLTYLTGPVSK